MHWTPGMIRLTVLRALAQRGSNPLPVAGALGWLDAVERVAFTKEEFDEALVFLSSRSFVTVDGGILKLTPEMANRVPRNSDGRVLHDSTDWPDVD